MLVIGVAKNFHCPGKEAALVIIVVSLTFTAYQCGSLITFYKGALPAIVETCACKAFYADVTIQLSAFLNLPFHNRNKI